MVSSAQAVCERVDKADGGVAPDDVLELVTSCTEALSSPVVSEQLCAIVANLCGLNPGSISAAGSRCVIAAVLAALSAHGGASTVVAEQACEALGMLAYFDSANANFIVTTAGGLDAVTSVMVSHASAFGVQRAACGMLYTVARAASPAAQAVMRRSAAGVALEAARRIHTKEGYRTVKYWAEKALRILSE